MPNPVSLRRLHYAWVVFAITFLTLIVTAAVRSAPGVLIVPLEKEFGWTRSTISVALTKATLSERLPLMPRFANDESAIECQSPFRLIVRRWSTLTNGMG
jgi:hypothetical protein